MESTHTVFTSKKEVHPVADIFPAMSVAQFSNLCNSIQENGQREPILLYENKIIDGRHRYQACKKIGIEPLFVDWTGAESDILAFVVDVNLHRRHLDESQRAMVASDIANMRQGERTDLAQICASTSQTEAAEMLNVSRRNVQTAKKVQDKGTTELVEQVRQGNISVSAAATIAALPEETQVKVTEMLRSGEAKSVQSAINRIAEESGTEQFGAENKKLIKWFRNLSRVYQETNSMIGRGGVVEMSKNWSPEQQAELIEELEHFEELFRKSKEDLINATSS